MSRSEPVPNPPTPAEAPVRADPARAAELDRLVDERVEESFPASDPPAGWAGEDPRDRIPGAAAVDLPAVGRQRTGAPLRRGTRPAPPASG